MSAAPSDVEYGGWSHWGTHGEQARIKLRNAPAWVRERAASGTRGPLPQPAAARPQPAAPAVRRMAGWLFATCCPGVSVPAHSSSDGERLPEQFTDNALASMKRQAESGQHRIPVTLGHRGPVIVTSANLDVLFRIHPLCGLVMEARLPDNELSRQVVADAVEGLGVSIGYFNRRQWIVDRPGVGRVRVVDDAVLDHVAVLPRSSTLTPCFEGARCFSASGVRWGCPPDVRTRAELAAYRVIKRQAGIGT